MKETLKRELRLTLQDHSDHEEAISKKLDGISKRLKEIESTAAVNQNNTSVCVQGIYI